ncbi:protein disulfide isomerase-like 5-2 [Salvia miltiorrhiza]|uniref:protein disulfide isomerase-like 5-2 n=1 Tax=Salvia miltiorrhiza TaxID=226208 RepID=UPI0025AD26C7|nr:protein disulfide isomerase-like 5-2 [Salvia miltiorrhiza]
MPSSSSSPTIHSPFSIFSLQSLLLFSFSLSLSISVHGNQFKLDGSVLELDDSNFDAAISKFDYVFVDFYAPWCGHCNRLAPELERAAPVLAGLRQPIVVAKVDADKHKKLASKHDVDGYPTLKMFMHGVPTEYYGPRKADLLVQSLAKFVAPDVSVLSSDSDVRDFAKAAGSDFPIFIGFGLNESVILDSAVKYKKKAWFSVANGFSDEIMTTYGLNKVPALLAIYPAYDEQSIFYGPFEENSLEDYIKKSLLPLVFPISQGSLKLLQDDQRKVLLTIIEDETEEKSKGLLEVLKAAASANPDLVFGYVGLQQWEDFAQSFEVDMKTEFPRMVVWDGNENYYLVTGSENGDKADMASQVSRFLEGYREGRVIHKRITGPSLMSLMDSKVAVILVLLLICVVLAVVLIVSMVQDEPLTVGTREKVVEGRSSALQQESGELLGPYKED